MSTVNTESKTKRPAKKDNDGDMERAECVDLVRQYDGEWPERFETELMQYLSMDAKTFPVASRQFEAPMMTVESFKAHAERFKSPHLWDGNVLRHQVS